MTPKTLKALELAARYVASAHRRSIEDQESGDLTLALAVVFQDLTGLHGGQANSLALAATGAVFAPPAVVEVAAPAPRRTRARRNATPAAVVAEIPVVAESDLPSGDIPEVEMSAADQLAAAWDQDLRATA